MTSPDDPIENFPNAKPFTDEEMLEKLNLGYNLIIKVLKRYCDLKEEYYNIISLWIIGTWFHKQFVSFPYLFINAMKGSGKSRLLKLIIALSWNGKMMNNVSESVLFRTAAMRTLGIDEFEHIGNKEKGVLRELLNSAYKAGTAVERVYKIKGAIKEEYKVETFNVYCPIAMANIWGMDEVLGDRCVSLIIEKSSNRNITKLLELFEVDFDIISLKELFSVVSVMKLAPGTLTGWNEYISNYIYTLTTLSTQTTQTTLNPDLLKTFKQINDSDIDSRHLELFFPLFILAKMISEETFKKTIETAKLIVKEKKTDDRMESRDVTFLSFISNCEDTLKHYIDDKKFIYESAILEQFRSWMGYDEKNKEFEWLNSKWIGRVLKRLNLIVEKKRMPQGMQIMVNFDKAKEKSKMFETHEEIVVEKVK